MRNTRIGLLVVTILLLSIGIVMIYSSSAIYAYERFGDSCFFLRRHLLYLALGILGAVFAMAIDYRSVRKYIKPFLVFSLLLLLLVLMPGFYREVGGAKRWLRMGLFNFQPSEFMKIALVLYLADVLSRKRERIWSFVHGLLPPLLILGFCISLILAQPDLGTAILLGMVGLIMFFVSRVNLVHLGLVALSSFPVLYLLILSVPYRRQRIMTFLNPWSDPRGTGFQIVQSFLALGCGGLFGVGLGMSRQKLFYLPASHTDFIFSIIGEELGLVGAVAVVFLFVVFICLGLRVARKADNLFGQFLALGIVSVVGLEAIINIGVVTGTLPTKGLPLPFISYGGSALIANMISVGLLLNVAREH